MSKEGKFVATDITLIDDFVKGQEIPESDLLIKNNNRIVQFKYVEPPKQEAGKFYAKPGVYNIETKGSKIDLGVLELRTKNLLTQFFVQE